MKLLHAEWFPIEYPQGFYDRMQSNRVIAIGCFYKVKVPFQEGHDYAEELVLIGLIFSKIEPESYRN